MAEPAWVRGNETPDDLAARLAEERAEIELGLQDFAAGRVVDLEDIEAWVDALERGENLPVPQSGR